MFNGCVWMAHSKKGSVNYFKYSSSYRIFLLGYHTNVRAKQNLLIWWWKITKCSWHDFEPNIFLTNVLSFLCLTFPISVTLFTTYFTNHLNEAAVRIKYHTVIPKVPDNTANLVWMLFAFHWKCWTEVESFKMLWTDFRKSKENFMQTRRNVLRDHLFQANVDCARKKSLQWNCIFYF